MPKAGADIVTTLGQEIDTGVQAGDGTVKAAGKSATPSATPRTSMLKSNGKGSTSSGKRKQKHYEDEPVSGIVNITRLRRSRRSLADMLEKYNEPDAKIII